MAKTAFIRAHAKKQILNKNKYLKEMKYLYEHMGSLVMVLKDYLLIHWFLLSGFLSLETVPFLEALVNILLPFLSLLKL